MSRRESPFERWSRRKTAARSAEAPGHGGAAPKPIEDEAAAAARAADASGSDAGAPVDAPEPEAEPDPADYGLPAIETLDKDSDFAAFLAAGVPEVLKRAALRKLWLSDPVLANLDGLNDYDQDFNVVDKVISAAGGRYRLGRGMAGDEAPAAETAAAPEDRSAESGAPEPDAAPPRDAESGATDDDGETEAGA